MLCKMKQFKKHKKSVTKTFQGEKFTFVKSKLKDKKYSVIVGDRVVHFGSRLNQQYEDKIGMYDYLDHHDYKKRKNFQSRMSKIMIDCEPAYRKKYSPLWFSWHFLW